MEHVNQRDVCEIDFLHGRRFLILLCAGTSWNWHTLSSPSLCFPIKMQSCFISIGKMLRLNDTSTFFFKLIQFMRDWNDFSRDREGTPTILCCWLHDYTNCQSVSHDFHFLSVQHCSSFLLEGKCFSGETNDGLFMEPCGYRCILSTNLKTRVAFCAQRMEDVGAGLLALHIMQASCPTFDSFPEGSPQPISSLHLKLFSSVAPINLVPSFAPSITALLCLPLGLVTLPSSTVHIHLLSLASLTASPPHLTCALRLMSQKEPHRPSSPWPPALLPVL